MNDTNDPSKGTSEPLSAHVTDENQQQEFTTLTPPQSPLKTSSRKKLLFISLGIVLVIAAAATWLLSSGKPNSTSRATTVQNTTTQAPKAKSSYNLVYATSENTGKTPENCAELQQQQLFIKPALSEAEAANISNLNPGIYIGHHETIGNKVAFDTYGACGSAGNTGVWYSSDAGKTYTKIFTVQPPKATTGVGDQITDLKFASDGNSLLIAFTADPGNQNTIKEINLSTKAITDVATFSSRGVFLYGYDAKNSVIYYSQGCYNCDGGGVGTVLAYDIANKSSSTFYENQTGTGERIIFNHDFTKALFARGTEGTGLGGGPPYTIEEIDVQTKQSHKVATLSDALGSIGYRSDDNIAYYTNGTNLYEFVDGASKLAWKSSSPISDILYYTKAKVVTVVDRYDIAEYDITTGSGTKLLHLGENDKVLGVATD